MLKKISLVVLLSFIYCFPAKSQMTPDEYKKSIANASLDQVFDRGLKGVGKCLIIPAILNSVQTWRVITSKSRSGILGNGVIDITLLGTLQVAHGYAWDSALSSLAYPNVLFPNSSYGNYKKPNSEENAASMLRNAVANDLCDITNDDLPTTKSVNMSATTSTQMKNNFRFYLDSGRNLRCTSTLHSKSVWNPTTCQWVNKSIVISPSACKRAYQKASVFIRAEVGNLNAPTVGAWTSEIERDILQADLPIKIQVLAEFASTKIEASSLGDISLIPAVSPNNSSLDLNNAARAKIMLDAMPVTNVVMPDWLQSVKEEIESKPQVSTYISNNTITNAPTPTPISQINIIKSGYLQPIRDIFPDMDAVVSGCGNPPINAVYRRAATAISY
jgi:hypothetical protein